MSKVTFSRTEKDFRHLGRITAAQCWRRGIVYMIVAAGIGIVLSLLLVEAARAVGYFPADEFMQTIVAVGIYFLSFYLLLRLFHGCGRGAWLAEGGNFLSSKTFQVTAKGLTEESEHHTSFTDWRGVTDIQETKEYLLFYIDRMQAYLVPKTAFKKPEDAAEFLKKAQSYRKKAGGAFEIVKKGNSQ